MRRCTLPVWKSIGLAADESRRSWSANDRCITRSRNAMRNAEMGAIIVRLRFVAAAVASSVRVRPSRDHSRRFTTEVRIHSAEMSLLWIVLLPWRGDKEPRLAQEFCNSRACYPIHSSILLLSHSMRVSFIGIRSITQP